MKKDYTHIVYIMDESGSMQPLKQSTIQNYSNFIKEQQKINKKCTFSLYRVKGSAKLFYIFDSTQPPVPVKSPIDITENSPRDLMSISPELMYSPDGWTPLYDTLGKAINETGTFLSALKEEERPDQVICIIDTDGYENASRTFDLNQIRSMIEHQQNKYNWKFLYFGANQDSFLTAESMGISTTTISNYQHDIYGNQVKYTGMSMACSNLRSAGNIGAQSLASLVDDADQWLKEATSQSFKSAP